MHAQPAENHTATVSLVPGIRVLLAVSDAPFRVVTRALLAQHPSLAVVAEATTAAEVLHSARLFQPDVVLLELGLPGQTTRALIRALRALPTAPRVVLLAWDDSAEYREAATSAGASLCVSKRRLDALIPALASA